MLRPKHGWPGDLEGPHRGLPGASPLKPGGALALPFGDDETSLLLHGHLVTSGAAGTVVGSNTSVFSFPATLDVEEVELL